MIPYNHNQALYALKIASDMNIPEEQTALAIAKDCGKKTEMEVALLQRQKERRFFGLYRSSGESLADILERVCTAGTESDKVRAGPVTIVDLTSDSIVFGNLSCIDADDNVFEQYDKLAVKKDIFRNPQGAQMDFTSYKAAVYCEQQGLFLPSFALSCNIAAASHQNRDDAEINKLLLQYKDNGNGYGWHAQNTVVPFGTEEVIHYPSAVDFGRAKAINAGCQRKALKFAKATLHECLLEEALRDKAHTRFVRQLTGLRDPSVLVEIGTYFGKPAKLWFPWSGQAGASYNGRRAAWFGCSDDYFNLDAVSYLSFSSATRGVRCEP